MLERPALLVATPAPEARSVAVLDQPAFAATVIGELAAGQHVAPVGQSPMGDWYAIPWAGGTGWVAQAHLAAVTSEAVDDPSGGLPFDWPVGTPAERASAVLPRRWYQAVGFNEAYALPGRRRAVHTGLDLNLRTGGDSDLGQPVYAAADGVVTASGAWPVWGNIVLIRHDLPVGDPLWSQYAHLRLRLVRTGDVVRRGQQIGTIGKGQGNRFAAHLHFEVRRRKVSPSFWPGMDHAAVERTYLDPADVIARSPGEPAAMDAGVPAGDTVLWSSVTTAAAAAAGSWLCLTVPVGTDPNAAPQVDLRPWTEAGIQVVLHLIPGYGEDAFLGAPFARAAAACAGTLTGRPWAVVVGADWDAPSAWPAAGQCAPAAAARSANGTLDLVREALNAADLAEVPVGPGPLTRRQAPHDPLPWWQAFVSDLADPGLWAVRAWTLGADPDLIQWTDQTSDPTDAFNHYRALLAAVPRQFAQRPALVMGVDPSEPWDPSAGWLAAAQAHFAQWNATDGPAVRAMLLSGTTAAPTRDGEQPWTGLGLFVPEPWLEPGTEEAAARALRTAGADFVVRKRLHGRAALPGGERSAVRRPDQAGTPAAWGWGTVAGVEADLEAVAAVAMVNADRLTGWVVEPVPGFPVDLAAAYMSALRSDLPGRPVGLAWRPGTPAGVVAAFAPWADVLMPFVPRTGALATTVAALRRFDRPVVPVLSPDGSLAADVFDVFRDHAAATGRPGAGLMHRPGTPVPMLAKKGTA
jgi:murein DD-endopeptidase MepM/ murein hydrolase activator NlpD